MVAVLTLDRVAKSFGGVKAIDDLSFDVIAGEVLGIIGPNGAGKSTLFNLICGFYRADKGRIVFDGKFIERLAPHQITRLGIARTFQLCAVFPSLTALDTVALAAGLRSKQKEAYRIAEGLLERFGLADKAGSPSEVMTPVDMKLLELCKALATQPQVVLLDEVMSGLTHVEAKTVLDQIVRLPAQGVTPIIVEHGMHIITAACKRVVVLNFGRKIADGTPAEVVANKAVIDSYLGQEVVSA
ncbi:MAG: ABC transporter ATP-binding protein [Chloroflexota bacterium]|nr:MAG: ABC transporter ATP-binding protein [Chloroflexota bacterium]